MEKEKATLKQVKKHKLTSEQIIKAVENPQTLKDLFPNLFESKLKVGKWMLTPKGGLYCPKNKTENGFLCYGFSPLTKQWLELEVDLKMSIDDVLATPQEVEQALVNEAKKRGFKDGVHINSNFKGWIKKNRLTSNNYRYDSSKNELIYSGVLIFRNGVWAEIIETPSDIIAIVEKYGKDKVLTIVEQYKN